MSWEATAWAMRTRVGDATLKLLLLTLANYANDQQETWHSQEKIAFDSEMSDRTIRRKLQELAAAGLIELVPRRRDDGTKTTTLIRLLMGQPANLAAGDHRPKEGVSTGQKPAPPPDTMVAGQESKGIKRNNLFGDAPVKATKKIKTAIPDSFVITDVHLKFARERGFEEDQARFMFDKFKSHHQSKGSLMLSWDAAWRTWVLNQVGFQKRDGWRPGGDRGSPII